ncbi:MAG: glycoside hydrolase, partial [Chloroflexi bacterium]|nr:glycoside hydrolase [Chloroflexota bacterium]
MHQPYYAYTRSGRAILPWVRLHSSKNYLRMPEMLQEYPRVKATFNLVPSLIEQIQSYINGTLTDRLLELAELPIWSVGEEDFVLEMGFSAPQDFIQDHPRYRELQNKYRHHEPFREAEILDLLTLFHLAWIEEAKREEEPIRQLLEKGSNYSRKDLKAIIEVQREVMQEIIPIYGQLAERGQIEITTSPYFHPILPLLVELSSAREASPHLPLPSPGFAHPEDAREHVRRAVEFHQQNFDHHPRGLWPSEGAVGQDMLSAVAGQVEWLASDEGILGRSLGLLDSGSLFPRDENGVPLATADLYQPYLLNCEPPLAMIFRDRYLSDLISFEYGRWEGKKAAEDLLARLHGIDSRLPGDKPHLVSIILDGENPWESYLENGNLFLNHLYTLLSRDEEIETVTPSEYLQRFPPQRKIERLAAGSWIDGNLEVWIGEPTHNRAWEALAETRQALVAYETMHGQDAKHLEQAWRDLYIAEGSDWFWWYSSRNPTPNAALFDQTLRNHLGNVYRRLGLPIAQSLHTSFVGSRPK